MRSESIIQSFVKWEQRIVIAYRVFSGLYVILTLLAVVPVKTYSPNTFTEFIRINLFTATAALIVVNIFMTFLAKRMQSHRDYMFMIAGTIACAIVTYVNPGVSELKYVFLLPIMLTMLFPHKRNVVIAGVLSTVVACGLFWINPGRGVHEIDNLLGLFIFLLILVGVVAISLNVMTLGSELINKLHEQAMNDQELIVRWVMREKDSKTDALTGLNNRRSLNEYVETVSEVCQQTKTALHLAILDIDNFKQVNDQFGHMAGDVILRRIAELIQHKLSETEFVARYGGEEFSILIADKSLDESIDLLEEIRSSIAGISHVELNGQHATVSIGLSTFEFGEDPADLFLRADKSLYVAKKSGKNCIIAN